MKTKNNNSKFFTLTVALFFVTVGTYNSLIINSDSEISGLDIRFVKRLDEVYGVTIPGRHVATTTQWQKIVKANKVISEKNELKSTQGKINLAESNPAPVQETITEAAVLEELNLSLVEVINPKKWQNGLNNSQFNGTLTTNNGVIEGLSVSLPNGEGISVSFSELTGNVFEYDIDGELYSGMMYQVDQNAYMVTLTNGPLEGTRLRFSVAQPEQEQQQNEQILAENSVDVGSFGGQEEVINEEILGQDKVIQNEGFQAQGFNLESSKSL